MKILNTDSRASIFIKHSQHNGFQANLNNYTGLYILPEWHLDSVSVTDDEKEIWSAEFGGGSTAENPFFIFDTQKIKSDLTVIAVDNKGKQHVGKNF